MKHSKLILLLSINPKTPKPQTPNHQNPKLQNPKTQKNNNINPQSPKSPEPQNPKTIISQNLCGSVVSRKRLSDLETKMAS